MNIKHMAILSLILLSACTPYSEEFDCDPGRGVGCKSLSHINGMVEEGKLPLEKMVDKDDKISSSSQVPKLIESKGPQSLITTQIKVWIAGYDEQTDVGKITHTPRIVYVSR